MVTRLVRQFRITRRAREKLTGFAPLQGLTVASPSLDLEIAALVRQYVLESMYE